MSAREFLGEAILIAWLRVIPDFEHLQFVAKLDTSP
jgi:hypothetical protein